MSRLIEDLLDLARARLAGGLSIKPEHLDLGTVIQRVVQEQQTAFPERCIELSVAGNGFGEWDTDRFAQVASNLIGNALQHGPADGRVRVSLDGTDPEVVVFAVANPGSIAADVLPHLFDPFRRGRRGPGGSDGLGLGLYIAQQIVHAHRGSVAVQTSDPSLTVFEVRVPRRPDAAAT